MRRVGVVLVALAVMNLVTAVSAANVVPDSKAGQQTEVVGAEALKPDDCASLTLSAVAVGGPGTVAPELVLGSGAGDTLVGGDGDDCILGGAGNDGIDAGAGTDVCIGGAGTDTYAGCESVVDSDPLCPAPGTQVVLSDADAYVLETTPKKSFGTGTALDVRSDDKAKRARALVGFALPVVPAGCAVVDARLRLNATAAAGGRTLEAVRSAAPWSETGVTWDTQPATVGPGATAAVAVGWNEWTVTAQVQALYVEGDNGFVVRDAAERSGVALQTFSSREGSSPPQLAVTFG